MGNIPKQFLNQLLRRVMSIEQVNAEARTVELAFSSDAQIERWPGIVEILSHEMGSCDLSRLNDKANLLFNHDPDRVLGVVESARIDADGCGRAVVRFGKSEEAERAWQDIQDGILSKVSVGYRIKESELSLGSDDLDVCTVTNWEPYEISLVTIPADPACGIGRNLNTKKTFMENTTIEALEAPAKIPAESKSHKIDIIAERNAAQQGEQDRVRCIIEAGKQYKMQDVAMEALASGRSVEETKDLFLAELNQRNHRIVDGSRPIGLSEQEIRGFSFVKLIRALSSPEEPSARKAAAFELDACAAAADKSHRSLKGTMIPVDVLTTPLRGERGNNTVSILSGSGYTGTGGQTVQTSLLSSSFIDVLRNRTVLMQLATQLNGLVGNVDIPKQTSTSSGYWIGEDEDATKQDVDFGLISIRPKTVANYVEFTRRLTMQSSLSVEMLVRNDLAAGIAKAIDKSGFYGDGTSNAPLGIKNATGIHSVKFANDDPTFKDLVAMETSIAQENSDVQSMAFVANPAFRGYAKTTLKFPAASTNGGTIWEMGNSVNGYRTEVTNQINTGDIFFGNFSDFLIGLWGGLEITVDPYTHSAKGRIRLVFMQDVDFAVRRPVSFCYGTKKPKAGA